MGNKVIIGVDDGIILDASRCVVVDTDDLGDADIELLENGTETEALSVANRLGARLDVIGKMCGWGEMHYGNSISLSPSALRDEFGSLVDVADGEAQAILEWGLNASDEKLDEMADFILQSDDLWDVWRNHVLEAVAYFYEREETK